MFQLEKVKTDIILPLGRSQFQRVQKKGMH